MRISAFILGVSSLLILTGCNRQNVTNAEFDRLHMRMSYDSAVEIIGAEPDDSSDTPVGPGTNVKMCTWNNADGTSLTIVFENNQARLFNQFDPSKIVIPSTK